jgi:hypothetical protein
MTSFRIRNFGSADWVQIDLSGDDEELEEELIEHLEEVLPELDGPLHMQKLNEDGRWEDLDA